MRSPDAERFERIVAELRSEFRTFRLLPKERSRLMRLVYHALLMRLWCPDFLTRYTTVIISWVYLPEDLMGTDAAYRVLRHERVHLRDCFRSGVLPFVLSYLFLLPAGLTCRALWEMRGYTETLRVELEDTGRISAATLDHVERQFTGSSYLFMCPFPGLVRRWLRRVVARLESERRRRDP
jgi:hypothetical protein